MADTSRLPAGEYIDPSLRQAVTNVASASLNNSDSADEAIQKGLLEIKEPPKFNSGSALNEAVIKRARDKFYDPEIGAGLQKYRYTTNQFSNLQNAANQVLNLYKLDKQAEEITRQRKAAEDAQRASVISSVLGLGGAIAGAAIGGPAGAVAGGQAGASIGSMSAGGGANTMRPMGG